MHSVIPQGSGIKTTSNSSALTLLYLAFQGVRYKPNKMEHYANNAIQAVSVTEIFKLAIQGESKLGSASGVIMG